MLERFKSHLVLRFELLVVAAEADSQELVAASIQLTLARLIVEFLRVLDHHWRADRVQFVVGSEATYRAYRLIRLMVRHG